MPADKYTIKSAQQVYYSDFRNNMDLNPITGIIAEVTNVESIKQAVKNLILTQRGERFYDDTIGTRLTGLMFDPMDAVTTEGIAQEIKQTINQHEPRITLINNIVTPDYDNNTYNVTIIFSVNNNPQPAPLTLEFVLQRSR